MKERIDLHCHTCYSDGSYTPEEVVRMAKKRNLRAIAITDHDTIRGVKEGVLWGKKMNVEVLTGVEFSATVSCCMNYIHLLGYLFDVNNRKIKKFTKDIENIKKKTVAEKLRLTNEYFKTTITYQEIASKNKGIPGTAHIIDALVDKGAVKKRDDAIMAFQSGLCRVSTGHMIHAKQAIDALHAAGGIAILAHLFAYKLEGKFSTRTEQEALIKELKSYGLDGIELFIPNLTKGELVWGHKLSKKYDLIETGGSDFHDEKVIHENILGGLELDYSVVERMKELKRRTR